MIVDTQAVVLKRYDYGESSQVVHLATAEEGRVSVIGKGIKKPSATLKGPVDLFQAGRVTYRVRRGTALRLLVRYEPTTGYIGLRSSLDRLYAAFYFTELYHEVAREHDAHAGGFNLLRDGLASLESASGDVVSAVVMAFELQLLAEAGFSPAIEGCARCGREAPPRARATWIPLAGGVVCRECRERRRELRGGVVVRSVERRVLMHLAGRPLTEATAMGLDETTANSLRRLLDLTVLTVLERPLRSRPFLTDPRRGYLGGVDGLSRSSDRVAEKTSLP